jgi:hypothetical protein
MIGRIATRRSVRLQKRIALAMAFGNRYCTVMSCRKIRRISAALMAIVLAVGLWTHGLGGPDVIIKSAMAVANDMPMSGDMPGKCDGCAGDEKGVATAVCSAFCGAFIASSAVVIFAPIPADILTPPAERIAVGRTDPPDPYPPRPVVLS